MRGLRPKIRVLAMHFELSVCRLYRSKGGKALRCLSKKNVDDGSEFGKAVVPGEVDGFGQIAGDLEPLCIKQADDGFHGICRVVSSLDCVCREAGKKRVRVVRGDKGED